MTTGERASYTFDLAEEMIGELAEEFGPAPTVEELRRRTEGKPAAEADEVTRSYFEDHGRRMMERAIALGEEYADRTYDTMLAALDRTGSDGWPFLAQRPIEIAMLGSQPIYTLPIVENSAYRFTWRLAFCETYRQLEEQLGAETAGRLPCQPSCIAATKRAFAEFGFDVDVTADARMPDDDYCQFTAPRVPRRQG